ncbi:hypothetical protein K0U07_05510 [bacterium]|nr:hypothetical protein [bacterium]
MSKKFFFLFSVFLAKGFALAISPVDLEINPAKGQGYYTLINDDRSQKVIAITTKERTIDEDGNSILTPTKDLLIYPKQVVLKAKEKRLVRVIYKCKETVSTEKAYRITFAEQNVDVDFGLDDVGENEKRAGLSFGVRFDGSVYVPPKRAAKANVVVAAYEIKEMDGEKFFTVRLKNTGTIHKHITTKNLELELLQKNEEEKENWLLLSDALLSKYIGNTILLLAGGERKIAIPCRESQIPENVLGVRITE